MPDSLSELVNRQHAESRPSRAIDSEVTFEGEWAYTLRFESDRSRISIDDGSGNRIALPFEDFDRIVQEYRNFHKLVRFANEGRSDEGTSA